ncbi:hypothetical protein CSUI_000907 [Cystoisospora suis]|uniref:Uncharacterized protein n=1 Tax=Cystoisospora suis TaxID=483139 RepID=A0A2C6LAM4_9APIC|nr:hypothetical protein CSUI_000907 [Cystoisospora suis]
MGPSRAGFESSLTAEELLQCPRRRCRQHFGKEKEIALAAAEDIITVKRRKKVTKKELFYCLSHADFAEEGTKEGVAAESKRALHERGPDCFSGISEGPNDMWPRETGTRRVTVASTTSGEKGTNSHSELSQTSLMLSSLKPFLGKLAKPEPTEFSVLSTSPPCPIPPLLGPECAQFEMLMRQVYDELKATSDENQRTEETADCGQQKASEVCVDDRVCSSLSPPEGRSTAGQADEKPEQATEHDISEAPTRISSVSSLVMASSSPTPSSHPGSSCSSSLSGDRDSFPALTTEGWNVGEGKGDSQNVKEKQSIGTTGIGSRSSPRLHGDLAQRGETGSGQEDQKSTSPRSGTPRTKQNGRPKGGRTRGKAAESRRRSVDDQEWGRGDTEVDVIEIEDDDHTEPECDDEANHDSGDDKQTRKFNKELYCQDAGRYVREVANAQSVGLGPKNESSPVKRRGDDRPRKGRVTEDWRVKTEPQSLNSSVATAANPLSHFVWSAPSSPRTYQSRTDT